MEYLVYSQNTVELAQLSDILTAPFLDDGVWVIYAYNDQHELVGAVALSIANSYNFKTKAVMRYGIIDYIASRKKGIGTILMHAAEQWFRDRIGEMTHKMIQVNSVRTSTGFYEIMGYKYCEEIDELFNERLYTMQKTLEDQISP